MNRKSVVSVEVLKEIESLVAEWEDVGRANLTAGDFDPNGLLANSSLFLVITKRNAINDKLNSLKSSENYEEINEAIQVAKLKLKALSSANKRGTAETTSIDSGGGVVHSSHARSISDKSTIDQSICSFCLKRAASNLMKCGRCQKAFYCDKECQAAAWKEHKLECFESLGSDSTKTAKESN